MNFILQAQNSKDGGWRYNPKDPGDTCVLGWQLTALKSAHMAGLNVARDVFVNAGKFLDSVAIRDGTEYGYQPEVASSPTMTAVGLLGRQYLGAKRENPMLTGGMKYLMNHLPDEKVSNVYYWYYGTPGHAQHEWTMSGTPGIARCAISWSARRSAMSISVPTEVGTRQRTLGANKAVG